MESDASDAPFKFRLLGPLEVSCGGREIGIGGSRQRALLALLLLQRNELVSRERLIDGLWGDEPPGTATNAVQVAVHSLRRLLGPERIVTRGTGYELRVAEGELDLDRFEQLVADALSQSPPRRVETLREALALWRGPALADIGQPAFAGPEGARLEERRTAVIEQRIDSELQCGLHAELVGELEARVVEHPYRERLRLLLMLALYRSGRQAESLDAYQAARRALLDDLGIEPGPALQELERAILRQDPSLQLEAPHARRTNLPAPVTRLIGRELEVAAAAGLLRREDVRLLTLTGAGGTGKTRLALAVAEELISDFDDGVWLVTLAAVRDPALVPSTIAATLGVDESRGGSLGDDLQAHLRGKHMLLVLDNFEHLAPAAALLAELLAAGPKLNVLVTSRSALRLSGEHEYSVPPLALPERATWNDAESLLRNDSVALFVARAQAARPDFLLNGGARLVAEICVALDGLPLALELAAARMNVLSLETLRERLEQRLPLLVRGPRDLPDRQRTLRSTIDWSYELLDPDERLLFARLSVFSGGCTLQAFEDVCDAGLDALASLVDKSLVRRRGAAGDEVRFGMLETIREYATERLEAGNDADEWRRRHARHFLALAEEAEPRLKSEEAPVWLARLEREHDNLRSALVWTRGRGASELELGLAIALADFWRLRGHVSEGRTWLESALSRSSEVPPALRATALNLSAVMAHRQGDHALARSSLEEALAVYRGLKDEGAVARTLSNLGGVAVLEGEYERATALFEETIPLFRAAGDDGALMITLSNLASMANRSGDHARGRLLGEEGLAVARRVGDKDQISVSLHNLGRAALEQHEHDDAGRRFAESLELGVELGYTELIAYCLEACGELAAARRDWERSARLLGAGTALFESLNVPIGDQERESYDVTVDRCKERLGERAFVELAEEASAMPLDELVACALATAHASRGGAVRPERARP
jgi:predicted ATPase/DNA-binding SARP family transcriptional activator